MKQIKKIAIKLLSKWHSEIVRQSNAEQSQRLLTSFKNIGLEPQIEFPFLVEGASEITIGNNFRCRHHFRLEAIKDYGSQQFSPKIDIGSNVTIETNCHIGAIDRIKIGDGVLIASNVFITDHSHGDSDYKDLLTPPLERKLYSKGPVIIGNNVWIGENVTILSGVAIGDNVIIGAKSLVTKSFQSNCVIGGNPAKIIKLI